MMTSTQHVYEIRPRKDKRGVDLISEALRFGRLWYGEPTAVSNAVDYAKFFSRSQNAVIRVYDAADDVIETHEHKGEFKGDFVTRLGKRHARGGPESGYCLINSRASSAILFASSIQFLLMLNFTFTVKTMADVANKYAENVAGAFYVDDQCIDCDLCRETAPASFKRNDDGGHTYVYKQPETPEEEALCKEAMEGLPCEAVGDDSANILRTPPPSVLPNRRP